MYPGFIMPTCLTLKWGGILADCERGMTNRGRIVGASELRNFQARFEGYALGEILALEFQKIRTRHSILLHL